MLQLSRLGAAGLAGLCAAKGLDFSAGEGNQSTLTFVGFYGAALLFVLAVAALTVVIERRKRRDKQDPSHAFLDRQINSGRELRDGMRYYQPADDEARRKVMGWMLETSHGLPEHSAARADEFTSTRIVEGSGVSQLIGLMDHKLNVLKAIRKGEPVPKEPHIVFEQPVLATVHFYGELLGGNWNGYALRFRVKNERGGEGVEAAWAEFSIYDADGKTLHKNVDARWADTEIPKMGAAFVRSVALPANGQVRPVDSVVQDPEEYDACYLCTNDSLLHGAKQEAFRVHGREYIIEMSVHAEKGEPVVQRVHLTLSLPPEFSVVD